VILVAAAGYQTSRDPLMHHHERWADWEMNWMAYNYAHDVELPGSANKPLVYFMYPQAETSKGRIDPFDPDTLNMKSR
jgi:hypothetical protein